MIRRLLVHAPLSALKEHALQRRDEVHRTEHGFGENPAVYLPHADKYHRRTRQPSQGQKGLDERALMASQRPSHPW